MGLNVQDLLDELKGTEKTAEETFANNIVSDEEVTKEASTETVSETEEATTTKEANEASEEETETQSEEKTAESETEKVEEKTAEKVEETKETEKTAAPVVDEVEWVKIAQDMGKIAAHSLYAELVAMGIMPASNADIAVPTISSVSLPQESPVTMAGEAKKQNKVGHDGFDERTKSASLISPEFLTEFHKKIFNKEEN